MDNHPLVHSRTAAGLKTTAPGDLFRSHTLVRWTSTPGPRRSRMASKATAFSHRNQSEEVPIFGKRTSTRSGGFSSTFFQRSRERYRYLFRMTYSCRAFG